MIIDISYFKNELYIDLNNTDVQTNLNNTIEWVEKKYLTALMGKELYLIFKEHITEEPYLTLISGGVKFNWNGSDRTYEGLKQMLACFTFCEYKKKNQSFNTDFGDVSFKQDAKSNISIQLDLINFDDAYNEGVELFWEAHKYMLIKGIGFELLSTNKSINYINSTNRLVI